MRSKLDKFMIKLIDGGIDSFRCLKVAQHCERISKYMLNLKCAQFGHARGQ